MKLDVQGSLPIGQLIDKRIPDLIDFVVAKDISREVYEIEASLDLSWDHMLAIITYIHTYIIGHYNPSVRITA